MTKAKNIITSTQGVGRYGSLRGCLFEKFAHDIIMKGGKFLVCNLNTDSESEEQFPRRTLMRFNRVNEIREGDYNVPYI